MNKRSLLKITASMLFSSALYAEETQSAMIDFKALAEATQATIQQKDNTEPHKEIAEFLKSALIDEAYEFLNIAYENPALRDLIDQVKQEIQDNVVNTAEKASVVYTNNLFESQINQITGYLALLQEIATHEKVVVRFTASWSPACQLLTPILEKYAQQYVSTIRVINIDITENLILGVSIESVPTMIFFRNGRPVYTQTNLNFEDINAQFTDYQSPAYYNAVLNKIDADLQDVINQYLLN